MKFIYTYGLIEVCAT